MAVSLSPRLFPSFTNGQAARHIPGGGLYTILAQSAQGDPRPPSSALGARFSSVRIPRSQMLARFANVSPEGAYSKPPHDKLAYGGMIFIRAQMIGSLAWRLAKGELSPIPTALEGRGSTEAD